MKNKFENQNQVIQKELKIENKVDNKKSIQSGRKNMLKSLVQAGLVLNTFAGFNPVDAKMTTGAIMNNTDQTVGSGFRFSKDNYDCTLTNHHVANEAAIKDKTSKFRIYEGNNPNSINPLIKYDPNSKFNQTTSDNRSDDYEAANTLYPEMYDIAILRKDGSKCTREFLTSEIGAEHILPIVNINELNSQYYKSIVSTVKTHRNLASPNHYENSVVEIKAQSLGITLNFNSTFVFLQFSDKKLNPKVDWNNSLVKGASGSFMDNRVSGQPAFESLLNTAFVKQSIEDAVLYKQINGVYIFLDKSTAQRFAEAQKGNPEFDPKMLMPMKMVIDERIKEFGYESTDDLYNQKGIVTGFVPISREVVNSLPAEK